MAILFRTSLRTFEGKLIAGFMVLAVGIGLSLTAFAASISHTESMNTNLTSSGITINWTSDPATDSCLKMGLSASELFDAGCVTGTRTSHSFNVSGLLAGTTYYYTPGYKNPAPEHFFGTVFSFMTPGGGGGAPTAPINFTATVDASVPKVTLTWIDNSTNESGFIIEREVAMSMNWQTVRTETSNTTGGTGTQYTWMDYGVTAGTTYNYRLKAVAGTSYSSEVWLMGVMVSTSPTPTPTPAPTPFPPSPGSPAAPSNLAGSWSSSGGGNGTVTLTWTDNATNETSFYINRRLQGVTTWSFEKSVGTDIVSTQVPAPASNGTYEYHVMAHNDLGNSAMSNIATVTMGGATSPTPMPTPSANTLSVQNWGLSFAANGNSIIGIAFNREMNQSTFTDANVYLYRANDAAKTHLPVTIQKSQYSVNLWTLAHLDAGAEYVTVVTTAVKSFEGVALTSEHTCRFAAIASGYLTSCPGSSVSVSPSPTPLPNADITKTINVTVTREDGTAVTDAMVGAWRSETGDKFGAQNLGGGKYRIMAGGGNWNIMVQPQDPPKATWGYFEGPTTITFKTDTTAETRDITFKVKAGSATVKGRVSRPDGTPPSQGSGIGIKEAHYGAYLNADGTFSLMLPPGTYTIVVFSADPLFPETRLASVTLETGKTLDLGTIVLVQPTGRITGKVTNKEGVGLANIPVHAFQPATEGAFARAVSGADGRYTAYVEPGSWMVRAEPYPESNYANPDPPVSITVAAGVPATANFTLEFADTTISGVVVDAAGAVLENFYGFVSAGDIYESSRYGGAVERGRFSFRVQSGTWPVRLFPSPGSNYISPPAQTVTVKAGASVTVKFVIAAHTAVIAGYVKDDTGTVLKNLSLRIAAMSGLASGAGSAWQPGVYDPATGSFRITVSPGTWYLAVDLQGTIGYAPPNPMDLSIAVIQGSAATKDIVLKRAGSAIQGTVRKVDGTPFPGVFVSADVPYGGAAQSSESSHPYGFGAQADANGFYRIAVPAGVYVIRAFAPPSTGGLNPQAVDVTVGAAENKTVDLRFRAAQAVIAGTVEGIGGKTFIYAWSDKGGYAQTETDEQGNYTLNVSKGEVWRVAVSGEADKTHYRSAETPISVTQDRVEANVTVVPTRKLPDSVSAVGHTSQVNVVGVKDGATITVPPNAISGSGNITITVTPDTKVASQAQDRVVGIGYGIEIRGQDARQITQFNADAIVTFPYTAADLASLGADASSLVLAYWDDASATWRQIENLAVDPSRGVVTGSVKHLTRFALVAPADTQPPDPPYGVAVAAVSGGYKITWSNPTFDFHHAKVHRSTEKGVIGTLVKNNVTEAIYTDIVSTAPNTAYYYVVRVVDLAGNESANTTQYTTAGPAQTPSPKELGPQAVPEFTVTPEAPGTETSAIPYNPQIPSYQKHANGTLLRAEGDTKVWIIMNGFKRYVVGPQIFGFYNHLKSAPIIDVPKEELDQYGLAAWVRYVNDPKVYEVNDDATKHWLDMSAEDFYSTGRRWEAVFVINKPEVDFYKTGVNVTIIK